MWQCNGFYRNCFKIKKNRHFFSFLLFLALSVPAAIAADISDCTNGQYWDADTATCNACPDGWDGAQYVAPNINGCLYNGRMYFDFAGGKYNGRYDIDISTGCSSGPNCERNNYGFIEISFLYDGQSNVYNNIMVCGAYHTSLPEPAKCASAKTNYYIGEMGAAPCPDSYPLSDGGNIGECGCYKEATRYGQQNEPELPSGCATQTTASCTPGSGTGTYRDYWCGVDGPSDKDCTRTIMSVAAQSGYYVDGMSCLSCPTGYSSPDGNTGNQSSCYQECQALCMKSGCPDNATCTYTETNVPGVQYYGQECDIGTATCDITSYTCDANYNKTSVGTCAQICSFGITTLRAGANVSVPLYATKQTTPAINIKTTSGDICYANLVEGASNNAINVMHNNTTYHTVE